MQPEFPRINQALQFTLEYFEIGRIREQIRCFTEPDRSKVSNDLMETYHRITLEFHSRMEAEINQTIQTTNSNTQVFLFERLKDWLQDWRIRELNTTYFITEIDNYNEKVYLEYATKIENDDIDFKNSPNYSQRKHLEEYEDTTPDYPPFFGGVRSYFRENKKKIYYRFRCLDDKPDIINTDYTIQYLDLVNGVVTNFRQIAARYVSWYESGKISSNVSLKIESTTGSLEPQPLLETARERPQKIKVNLTIPQLSYLFKMLYELKIIETSTVKEIHQFISTNFHPASKGDSSEDISVGKLGKIWSDFDIKTANFWAEKFIELRNQAKKNNPNNIK